MERDVVLREVLLDHRQVRVGFRKLDASISEDNLIKRLLFADQPDEQRNAIHTAAEAQNMRSRYHI
jgi:hypothetical protein